MARHKDGERKRAQKAALALKAKRKAAAESAGVAEATTTTTTTTKKKKSKKKKSAKSNTTSAIKSVSTPAKAGAITRASTRADNAAADAGSNNDPPTPAITINQNKPNPSSTNKSPNTKKRSSTNSSPARKYSRGQNYGNTTPSSEQDFKDEEESDVGDSSKFQESGGSLRRHVPNPQGNNGSGGPNTDTLSFLESATFNGQPYDDVPRNELHPFMRCVTVGSVKSYQYHLHPMWDAGKSDYACSACRTVLGVSGWSTHGPKCLGKIIQSKSEMFPQAQAMVLPVRRKNAIIIYDIEVGPAFRTLTFLPPVQKGDHVVCLYCNNTNTPLSFRKHICDEIRQCKQLDSCIVKAVVK